jgi:hypothetical protein
MGNDPKWWGKEHSSAWERARATMKRDWESTKAELSKGTANWDLVESNYRYGVGAWWQYRNDHKQWDDRLESKLRDEWNDLKNGRPWDDVKASVRRAWERGGTR